MHCYIRTDVVGYLKHKRCTTYVLWYFLVLLDNFGLSMMMDVSVCFVGCVYTHIRIYTRRQDMVEKYIFDMTKTKTKT